MFVCLSTPSPLCICNRDKRPHFSLKRFRLDAKSAYAPGSLRTKSLETAATRVVTSSDEGGHQLSPVKGLQIDESTDVSHTSQMVIYLRLLMGGKFQTVFFRIVSVHDASALGLVTLLTNTFSDDGISLSNFASLATDGASVLTGRDNGHHQYLLMVGQQRHTNVK